VAAAPAHERVTSELLGPRRPLMRTRLLVFAGRNLNSQIVGIDSTAASCPAAWSPFGSPAESMAGGGGGGGRVVAGTAMKLGYFFCTMRLNAPHSMEMRIACLGSRSEPKTRQYASDRACSCAEKKARRQGNKEG